jgi:hypothetical protein
MSLNDIFNNEDFFNQSIYYSNNNIVNPMNSLTEKSCQKFIEKYFALGRKRAVFKIDFKNDFESGGKHIHTFGLYLLGIKLKSILLSEPSHLMDFFKSNIDNNIDCNDSWFDFRYTWFLSCLFHDTASIVEKKNVLNYPKDLNSFLEEYKIEEIVFRHPPLIKGSSLFTYSENLVGKYFHYRINHSNVVDHGILGGYILYDKLIKNYNKAWKRYMRTNPTALYENFEFNNLSWKREHQDHFALISDAIIAHNIWFSSDESLYRKYGLESLIISAWRTGYILML